MGSLFDDQTVSVVVVNNIRFTHFFALAYAMSSEFTREVVKISLSKAFFFKSMQISSKEFYSGVRSFNLTELAEIQAVKYSLYFTAHYHTRRNSYLSFILRQ